MSEAAKIASNNSQVEKILNARDYKNKTIASTLKQSKIAIFSNPNFERQTEDYYLQALKFSELNLLFILATRNEKDYENAINNVKFFYENTIITNKPKHHSMITSVHLLFLLSSNRNEQFYGKIESLTNEDFNDKYIKYVLSLNDAIQEGNYRKVFKLRENDPLKDYFGPFLDKISETIRTEIAKSAQKAYGQLSVQQALSIFQFKTESALKQFSQNYNGSKEEPSTKWIFEGHKIIFDKQKNKKVEFNSEDLIKTALQYSMELQKIA